MSKRGSISMTAAQIRAHAAKNKLPVPEELERVTGIKLQPFQKAIVSKLAGELKPRQNKTEAAFGRILEAMKRRGEIVDYKPFGMRLEWGAHPETGKPMVYSPDFTVFKNIDNKELVDGIKTLAMRRAARTLTLIEVKGPHIYPKDLIRFRGCRAEWPMFQFEMHQRDRAGTWRRIE